jgi:hypothetical protein
MSGGGHWFTGATQVQLDPNASANTNFYVGSSIQVSSTYKTELQQIKTDTETFKTQAQTAKTGADTAKTAADAAKKANVDAAEAKCKSPVYMNFIAKVGANAAVPTTGPVSPNIYWTFETVLGATKQFIWIPSKDKSDGNTTDALTYCGKVGKFLILLNKKKERNIQYKIIGVERTSANADAYFKFNIENVGGTSGFTKSNIVNNLGLGCFVVFFILFTKLFREQLNYDFVGFYINEYWNRNNCIFACTY